MYLYIPASASEPCFTGFQGVLRDANMVEVLIQCMGWNMTTRQSSILELELPELQQKAVDLLDMLQKNLPDETLTGERGKWNFEKAHSILNKVHEIVLWGNSDNTSCQAPELHTWYILVHNWYILICSYIVVVHTKSYWVHT
jgi:hypothetical protein